MGRPWSVIIMPLLSTLAALVILAHSAEEEAERGLLHHESSPRFAEPGSPDYDQSWRAVEVQPMMQENHEPPDEWGVETAPQEPFKRRRPGRKRKRRPQQSTEDLIPEEHRSYTRGLEQEAEYVQENVESIRRRRKRPEGRNPNRWNEEFEEQRPLRKRHRRKRPVTTMEPDDMRTADVSTITQEHYEQEFHIENTETQNPRYLDEKNNEHITTDYSTDLEGKMRDSRSESGTAVETMELENINLEEMHKHDTSTSEKRDKSYRVPYSLARKQEPLTGEKSIIKELLKQSGGLSLSELLQQRNLSLSDLLNGKENAISALTSDSTAVLAEDTYKGEQGVNQKSDHAHMEEKHETKDSHNAEDNSQNSPPEESLTIKPLERVTPPVNNNYTNDKIKPELNTKENQTTQSPQLRRRLPPGSLRNVRKRIRNPHIETTTLSRPHYNFKSSHPRRRQNSTLTEATPVQEAENLVEAESIKASTKAIVEEPSSTTTTTTEKPTTLEEITTTIVTTTVKLVQTEKPEKIEQNYAKTTGQDIEKPKLVIPALRPKLLATNSELRRQAQNNRRRKKLRNKAVIPNNAQEIAVQDLFGMANLISASEFITKIHTTPQPTSTTTTTTSITTTDIPDLFTDSGDPDAENIVPDKDKPTKVGRKIEIKLPKYTPVRHRISTTTAKTVSSGTTEETAKEEILEVLKDMQGGARLAKILYERNMTINELVQHRERGSSQIHLADIFHNASREPNPPEPFLSKSLIEPISKETYPLRALLEANHHDPELTSPTQNPYAAQYTNIPLIVDYGRNIHENGENLGIVTLFNDFTNKAKYQAANIKKDSEGTAYFTSVMSLNTTEDNFREGRAMPVVKKSEAVPSILPHAAVPAEKVHHQTHAIPTTQGTTVTASRTYAEKDVDGDGLIVLEDLQHLNDLDHNLAQAINEKLEVQTFENSNTPETPGFLAKFPSSVKSATIASASIAGITMILFLITYIGCKWRQRRKNLLRKDSFRGERIPTPVFEHRKSTRNCSTRSISPMLASSNGFTMSTLDSHTGKESPDYMWDTLHKPFQ